MKIQRDRLHQYQRRITVLTDKETDVARQMIAKGDKKRALLALRRKKYQETLLAKTDAQLEQLEKLTANVEFARIQKDVVFGLQQGTKVLSDIHAEMGGLDKVEKLMGDTADEIAYQKVRLHWGEVHGVAARILTTWYTGGERDARRAHDKPGRRRGRGRAGGSRGRVGRAGRASLGSQRPAPRRTEGGTGGTGKGAGKAGYAGSVMEVRLLWRWIFACLILCRDLSILEMLLSVIPASNHIYTASGQSAGLLELEAITQHHVLFVLI